ncbi:DUF2613 domain-containing protein [Dietzia sp.]|uniref:DUF2613 domain-containing protein n=1 Tax=Dietzia sp. TaxID=1871616 RepID=UPI002FDA418E
MKSMTSGVVGLVAGAVVGVAVALIGGAAFAQNSVPELDTPPADQALFGQVEYGSRN